MLDVGASALFFLVWPIQSSESKPYHSYILLSPTPLIPPGSLSCLLASAFVDVLAAVHASLTAPNLVIIDLMVAALVFIRLDLSPAILVVFNVPGTVMVAFVS